MQRFLLASLVALLLINGTSMAADSALRVKLITSVGDITIELNPAAAPKTVSNFLAYVKDGFYDGTVFHRVIAGFMIQGGGFDADLNRKPTRPPIPNEADNGLSNKTGTVAMARTRDPHSASTQFFINVNDNGSLDYHQKTPQGWGYCVFGKVIGGMNVVRSIENMPTTFRAGMGDVPETLVVINRAMVVAAN